ncbi:MAG: hypothetical protein HYS17_08470 [Micavibrio aeruginosavorus]|uniref:Uncharacterized protein n=1 Tax=Micavibrio aeruginosavorus TaxID=349221 RepID=A0A7T5UHF3_9BACT|nr:MAG: hypothetical protein HYS17_08470 [Micavibrio aeruginosavorus]
MAIKRELYRIFQDIATDPAVWFSTGNLVWSLATAEPLGIALNAAVTAAATGARIRNSLREEEKGLVPLYITGTVNCATSVSALIRGAMDPGLSHLFDIAGNPEARKQVFSALAYAGWGITHLIMGYQQRHGISPRALGNPMIYAGIADVSILLANPGQDTNYPSLALVSAGLFQASFREKFPTAIRNALSNKHITPVRLYAASYITGSFMAATAGNPLYAGVLALWGGGYTLFDPAIRQVIRKTLNEICRTKKSCPQKD